MTPANEKGIQECCRRVSNAMLHRMREAAVKRIWQADTEEEKTHATDTLNIVDREIVARGAGG